MTISIAVPKETRPGERRVSLIPESAAKLIERGVRVLVESGAGSSAYYSDDLYAAAGAILVSDHEKILADADVILKVQPPTKEEIGRIKPAAILISLLNGGRDLDLTRRLREAQATSFALELIPRISRAQGMDVLSSQATVAGYKAALLAADHSPRFFPMLTTAAGTIRPAKALVLGAGVAGLMAVATVKRLGAIIEAYDVRKAAGENVRALGAKFIETSIDAQINGGYARELTADERAQEKNLVSDAIARADVIITTANVFGRRAPILIDRQALARMQPGSVIVDAAAESGGNCEATKPGELTVENGVIILGPTNLPAQLPFHASRLYSKNQQAFLDLLFTKNGELSTDISDEILSATMLTRQGKIVRPEIRELLEEKA
ncbi:MAG: NAD(P) transhydrogenase subunit alpha [Elusimicrobiota bacterium]